MLSIKRVIVVFVICLNVPTNTNKKLKNMHKVCLEPIGKELEVNHNTPLRDIVAELGLEFPCGGNGFCGNCKVRIMAGDIEVSEQHARMLQKKDCLLNGA